MSGRITYPTIALLSKTTRYESSQASNGWWIQRFPSVQTEYWRWRRSTSTRALANTVQYVPEEGCFLRVLHHLFKRDARNYHCHRRKVTLRTSLPVLTQLLIFISPSCTACRTSAGGEKLHRQHRQLSIERINIPDMHRRDKGENQVCNAGTGYFIQVH